MVEQLQPPVERVTAIVRVSPRARRMRLLAHPGKGLELVVTPRTTQRQMEDFLAQHAAWAARKLKQLDAPLDARDALEPPRPEEMILAALGERWRTEYQAGRAAEGKVRMRLRDSEGDRVVEIEHGNAIPPVRTVSRMLLSLLRERARQVLPDWVERIVQETGLPVPATIRIGLQRTVWGSRSAGGTLSLSARLLLLPPELVRHVIVHELCHARHMHHRPAFHRLLERHDPDAREHRRLLRELGRKLPAWWADA